LRKRTHWISIKHNDGYIAETSFRWNHRGHGARLVALFSSAAPALEGTGGIFLADAIQQRGNIACRFTFRLTKRERRC
jgi:hypothetical protein